jgi:transcriptional regulator with XRE-family HTH domain
LCEPVRV